MIIGINGRIGSGKDTVGSIIQYLDCKRRYRFDYPFEDFIAFNESQWKVKKFAGKLKQIASLLTGISVEKFEDQEFKKTLLGEEWGTWSTLHFPPELSHQMTVREFLQKLGTDAIRDNLHTNTWVNALMADYQGVSGKFKEDSSELIGFNYPNWLITDTRFPNEAQAVKDKGGIVIRVNRNLKAPDYKTLEQLHPSETSLDNWDFDYVIENDGSIEELIVKVEEILNKFNLW